MINTTRLLAAGLAGAALFTACTPPPPAPGPQPSVPTTPSFAPSTPTEPLCVDLVDAMGRNEQIAQLFMVGVDIGSGKIDPATANLLDDTGVGNVLLLGNSEAGVAGVSEIASSLRGDSRQPGGVELMIAADQEGGRVQRLQGEGFPEMPSASAQAAMSDDELTVNARQWGEALRQAGIDYDLAPVADVVPADNKDTNTPIGALDRDYGSDPAQVRQKAQAFINGMDEAEIATATKHFPGLGRVVGNTDLQGEVVDSTTTEEDLRDFVGYENLDSVMVSSAVYENLDPGTPAVYSRKIITGMLRIQLDWSGVIVSDDLGVAKAAATEPVVERGAAFLGAGGDLVITADPDTLAAMMEGVRQRAVSDEAFANQLPDKAARVLELKSEVGRANCRPGRPLPTPPAAGN
ncbi:glycoside hydrolase family 3 protein [Naumannella cuiyingiana]|uniref:beta-N-acetylhexosaminidase n=1 Tax=Naumannella cuiyingiana TaxID=1347891 RepID=A0A7Z0DA19_9ACTN|nr:glycoside hydrolase family 3 protein [Naumannella cuiyingiana]NYI71521.1 beta-N-acetylhexosaminidase [Naumannella cuiyingiana]